MEVRVAARRVVPVFESGAPAAARCPVGTLWSTTMNTAAVAPRPSDVTTVTAGAVTTVTTVSGVRELADSLCTGAAGVPALVVTAVNRTREVYLDLSRITDEFSDAVRLVVIENPNLTRMLTGVMPTGTTPYNGAARIYPTHDLSWMDAPFADDLLFAGITEGNAARVTDVVVNRLRMVLETAAAFAELDFPSSADGAAEPGSFCGEFTGELSSRAGMVTSPDAPGSMGMLHLDLDALRVDATVTVAGLFGVGDEVRGMVSAEDGIVSLEGLRSADAMTAELVGGRCYPAVVTGRGAKSQVRVQVVPGVESTLTQRGIDEATTAGDVVAVCVQSVGERDGRPRIAVGPVGDADVTVKDAPAMRDGGPGWIALSSGSGVAAGAADAETEEPATTDNRTTELEVLRGRVPALRAQISDLSAQMDILRDLLASARGESDYAWDENDRLNDENTLLRARLAAVGIDLPAGVGAPAAPATPGMTATTSSGVAGHRPRGGRKLRVERQTIYTECVLKGTEFSAPDDQLKEEIRLSWVRNVDAPAKADHPLRYSFGPGFLASVEKTVRADESARRKLSEVLAWVAAGYEERTSRHHAYRAGTGGGAPQIVRHTDGAKAFRVNLETNTAAARRLHYWKLPDGSVEFHSVNLHDDFPSM